MDAENHGKNHKRYWPKYGVGYNDLTYYVEHCFFSTPSGGICNEMTLTKSFSVPPGGTKLVYPTATGGWVNAAALTGWLMDSPNNGAYYTGTTFIKMGQYCPGWPGLYTSCWDYTGEGGIGVVYMASSDQNQKFVLAHEIGHQCQYDRIGHLGGYYEDTPADSDDWQCRCDHVESSNQLHCMQSREEFDTALMEGFAYFFAAKLFNDETEGECWMAHSKEFKEPNPLNPDNPDAATIHPPPVTFDCRDQVQWQADWCEDEEIITGVEWDWMNFFWEWHTGGGSNPNAAAMWEIYEVIDAEDNNGVETWEETRNSAEVLFGGVYDPQYEYFNTTAADYGVIQ